MTAPMPSPIDAAAGRLMARKGPRLAKAMTSPSTILVTGACTALAIATGAPALLIGGAAIGSYLAKVAVSTFTAGDVRTAIAPKVDRSGLRPPYSVWLDAGIAAKARYTDAVRQLPTGPLRERLGAMADEMDDVLNGTARVARRAQGIEDYLRRPQVQNLRLELDQANARLRTITDPDERVDVEKRIAALDRQAGVAQRLGETHRRAVTRMEAQLETLDQLTAELMEMVLTADAGSIAESSGGIEVDALVSELESVRSAVRELDPAHDGATDAEREVEAALAAGGEPVALTAVPEAAVASDLAEARARLEHRPEGELPA